MQKDARWNNKTGQESPTVQQGMWQCVASHVVKYGKMCEGTARNVVRKFKMQQHMARHSKVGGKARCMKVPQSEARQGTRHPKVHRKVQKDTYQGVKNNVVQYTRHTKARHKAQKDVL